MSHTPAEMVQALHAHVGTGAMAEHEERLIDTLSHHMQIEQVRPLSGVELETLARLHKQFA